MPGCDPVQPDLLVVSAADRGIIRGGRVEGVPALLVEVQSPSSVGYNDRVKRQAYARAGAPEYWIVRPATRDVLVCTRPDATLGDFAQSQLVAPGEDLVSPTLLIRLAIDAIFADAPDATL
jgi:Uma2 family endonuclease